MCFSVSRCMTSTKRLHSVVSLTLRRSEPPRESWRLYPLRGWSNAKESLPAGGP